MSELVKHFVKANPEYGSRELDCLVHEWFYPEYTPDMRGTYYGEASGEYFGETDRGKDVVSTAPNYTTSLDAAIKLIKFKLPGMELSLVGRAFFALMDRPENKRRVEQFAVVTIRELILELEKRGEL